MSVTAIPWGITPESDGLSSWISSHKPSDVIDRFTQRTRSRAMAIDVLTHDEDGACNTFNTVVPSATAIQFGEGVNSWIHDSELALCQPITDARLLRQLSVLSPTVSQNVYDFLLLIADIWPIPPGVVPDEDGVAVLYWASDDMSVEVDISEHGVDYGYFFKDGHGTSLTDYETICEETRRLLSKMKLARITWQAQHVTK